MHMTFMTFLSAIWLPHGQLWAIIEDDNFTDTTLINAFCQFSTGRSSGAS